MYNLQHAISSLLTLFFGPHADGRALTSWGEILGWVVVVGLLGLVVYSVGYVLGRRTCLPDLSTELGCRRQWQRQRRKGFLRATGNPPSEGMSKAAFT